jgi:hypothetical protein
MADISPCDDGEVLRIAQDLSAKYGRDAFAFVKSRADRAHEIGDELAYDIWKNVLAVINAFKAHQF